MRRAREAAGRGRRSRGRRARWPRMVPPPPASRPPAALCRRPLSFAGVDRSCRKVRRVASGKSQENRVPLLVLGAAVGVLLGGGLVVFLGQLFDDDDDGPIATRTEVERAAASINRIQRHCGARRRVQPTKAQRTQARRALSWLLTAYRRRPEKRFRLDDSADPTTLDDTLHDIVFNTFDGPCPEIARRGKSALLRTP
jgi:hypothetical protein